MNKKLTLAVNHVGGEIRSLRSEMIAAYQDPKHTCFYEEMGCTTSIGFKDTYALYDREGTAFGAINQISDKCFETNPRIVEGDESEENTDETTLERDIKRFFKRTKFWSKFKEADKRRMIGEYSGLVIQVKDNKDWSAPLEQFNLDDVLGFIPVWEVNLKVNKLDEDQFSPRFGMPLMYNYDQQSLSGEVKSNAIVSQSFTVHHSRVILIGDTQSGRSLLKSGFNAFKALEKVTLSGGEGVYKNAASHIQMNFSKDVDLASIAKMYGVKLEELSDVIGEQVKALNSSFDSAVITQDAETKILSVSLPDLRDSFDNPLAVAAASLQVPSTIIIGMQTGERASQQDNIAMAKRCTSRRVNDITPFIDDAMALLKEFGAVDQTELTVVWDSLLEASDAEKLANAKLMAETNSNVDIVFTASEIRVAAGLPPSNDELIPLGEGE